MEKKQQIIWRSLSNLLFCHVSKEGAVDPAARHSTSFDVPSSRAVPAEEQLWRRCAGAVGTHGDTQNSGRCLSKLHLLKMHL